MAINAVQNKKKTPDTKILSVLFIRLQYSIALLPSRLVTNNTERIVSAVNYACTVVVYIQYRYTYFFVPRCRTTRVSLVVAVAYEQTQTEMIAFAKL